MLYHKEVRSIYMGIPSYNLRERKKNKRKKEKKERKKQRKKKKKESNSNHDVEGGEIDKLMIEYHLINVEIDLCRYMI